MYALISTLVLRIGSKFMNESHAETVPWLTTDPIVRCSRLVVRRRHSSAGDYCLPSGPTEFPDSGISASRSPHPPRRRSREFVAN